MKYFFSLIICSAGFLGFGQNTIKGTVKDYNGEIIAFAKIKVNDSTFTSSDIDGEFLINNLSKGYHTIDISMIGLMPYQEEVKFKKDSGTIVKIDATLGPAAVLLKPAVYLYNDAEMNVTIKLSDPSELIFTLPSYQDEWNVTLRDGVIKGDNHKTYDYLYWEGASNSRSKLHVNHDQGFCVESCEAAGFLEKQLDYLGLNDKEKNDFIAYWGPKISANAYSKIQFLVDEEYDQIMGISISPKPDAMRRVYILVQALDGPIDISAQDLTSFDRRGFTVVEWGGSIVPKMAFN